MKQLIIGFTTDGPTDIRFLESIIQRTFEDIAFECDGDVMVLPLQYIEREPGSFIEMVQTCAHKAIIDHSIMVLCIHTDAEAANDHRAFEFKITPAFESVQQSEEDICKNLVAVVPVRMTEAWLLADKDLLKAEIGTSKSDNDLKIHRAPETFADPKAAIEEAIRIARADLPARRRHQLPIAELYQPIGQKIQLEKLERLAAYQKFKEAVRQAYRKLNYLHEEHETAIR